MNPISTIGVAGAGAWGVALANVAAGAGRRVILWGRGADAMRGLVQTRQSAHLPSAALASSVVVSADIGALAQCEAALVVVPAQATRLVADQLARILPSGAPLVACAKGIELGSDLFMTEVLAQAAPGRPAAILSGPSFASDVAAGLPTAVTLACADEPRARALALALNSPSFRLYHSTDVRGVEIGGAAKNVLAIACGIASGLGLGPSAGAALIARGFAELSRFGAAFGARPQTLMGLSGLGDLVLTCTSPQSRNFAFGVALGRGKSAAEASAGKLAEGATTARALLEMARARGVEMPIAASVEAVMKGEQDVRAAVGALLARPARAED
ncbi:NAD(P)H-dependent glycerol-3-phosphate dehydrogenase [Methylocapsa sp. S129]|uniref:NAD(P)H-dependent glycerol-3-phosphate dehydrogenase n=1 Tax=Methylocapsa sp. S129 TaxID=1641869 RepID=UPI00131AC7C6|nr:NAD(P)H-dependent glycerol-3-phosphate dehydrogenase [Methylocapsa sp. S129]